MNIVYTDGACTLDGTKLGSWSACEFEKDNCVATVVGYETQTTSNRMEIVAIAMAMEKFPNALTILSDSQYAVNVVKGKWRASKNLDLVIPARERYHVLHKNHGLEIHWVKGHAGILGNERADMEANKEMKRAYNLLYKADYKEVNYHIRLVDTF